MTIVTYRHRHKRRPKLAPAADIKVPRIVQHTPKGRAWVLANELPPDPEADACIAEFLARMTRPR